jgi:hypothetical protein
MKRNILYILAFLASAIVCESLQAQVIIGATPTSTFHEGAILELNTTGSRGGLLMPKVALTSATVWAPVDGTAVNGMTVYNTNPAIQNGLTGKGVYVWTEGRWYPFIRPTEAEEPCTAPPYLGSILKSGGSSDDLYQPFLAYVELITGTPATYEWTLPNGLIGWSESNMITIVGTQAGTYTIRVRATSACGVSNEVTRLIEINPELPPNNGGENGNAAIQGVTCYDIAQTYRGAACGTLSSRAAAFPTVASRTRTYTLSIQNIDPSISNLRVGYMDDADGIVQSVTGNQSGTLTNHSFPITVVFADNVNTIVANKTDYTSTFTLYAIWTREALDYYVKLDITVQDCACCPLTYARIVNQPAYMGPDYVQTTTGGDTIGVGRIQNIFTPIPNSALCVWKNDQGNPVLSGTNSWDAAYVHCSQTMQNDPNLTEVQRKGWRLPNVYEMYYFLHDEFLGDGGSQATYSGASRYFASTFHRRIDSDRKLYTLKTGNERVIQSSPIDYSLYVNYRCIKTISQ